MLRIPGWWLGYRRAVRSIRVQLAGEVGKLPCLSDEGGWGKKKSCCSATVISLLKIRLKRSTICSEVGFLRIPTFSKRPQCRKANTHVPSCLYGIAHIALIVRKMNTEWLPRKLGYVIEATSNPKAEQTREKTIGKSNTPHHPSNEPPVKRTR